ncbi:MAG: tyrosine-type recombinase/integrase [Acidobacteriia bacterium]|nr:tyrosine-type recombinase/integrase [Terriglobia bacterium]
MLTIFRRHTKDCIAHHHGRDPGRTYRRCQCPLHAEGHLGGVMHRKTLDTSSWTRAQELVREKEARGTWHDPDEKLQVTVADAVTAFLQTLTAQSNGKAKSTTRKIRTALTGVNPQWALKTQRKVSAGLLDFCRDRGIVTLAQLSVPLLAEHAASWTCGPRHRSKRIQVLRRFFQFCMVAEWLEKNPALGLEHPRGRATTVPPKQPFDAQYLPEEGPEWKATLQQVQDHPKLLAFTLLMRRAGLRISDAVTFHPNRLMADGSILLYMSKTHEPVSVPVHPQLRSALDAIEPNAAGYYFWSGESAIATATDNWRRRLSQVFKNAGIEGGHPHRFRDTFAVDLLLRGVPLDQVSILLGHSSVKVTERHYLAFVAARREQIANSVRRAWASGTAA